MPLTVPSGSDQRLSGTPDCGYLLAALRAAYLPVMQLDRPWDAALVGEALVRAYRLLEGAPVMSRGDGFVVDDTRVDPRSLAAWIGARHYVTDPQRLRILRVWANCTARREQVRPRFVDLGWHPKTADRQRRAALAAIAAGLNAEREVVALAAS